jgi:hypothetical protein
MPVPSSIADLSQTAGSNYPAGSESPITTDDYLRTHAAFIAMLRDGKGISDPVTLASAATTDIGAQNSMFVEVTGTTTITSLGTTYNGPRFLRFTGSLLLTHNATTLNLNGGANITTYERDLFLAMPNSAGNGWDVTYLNGDSSDKLKFSAYSATGNVTVATATATKVVFTSEDIDPSSSFDTTTGRFTVPTGGDGDYQFSTTVQIVLDQLGTAYLYLYKNGSRYKDGSSAAFVSNTNGMNVHGSFVAENVAAGDYFEVYVYQSSGVNASLIAAQTATFFAGKWIGK